MPNLTARIGRYESLAQLAQIKAMVEGEGVKRRIVAAISPLRKETSVHVKRLKDGSETVSNPCLAFGSGELKIDGIQCTVNVTVITTMEGARQLGCAVRLDDQAPGAVRTRRATPEELRQAGLLK